jgi:hypothetical protein
MVCGGKEWRREKEMVVVKIQERVGVAAVISSDFVAIDLFIVLLFLFLRRRRR